VSTAPGVSIVLPVRDGARFLDAAIQSLRDQRFADFELIAIDDGSRDATPALLARQAALDLRLRVIRQEPRGIVAALNRGIEEARAPLIARMDADDVALSDRLERQVAFLGRNPDIALAGTAVIAIDTHGRALGVTRHPRRHRAIVAALRRGDNAFAHPSVMMRRDAVMALGGYREAFRHAEDFDLWLRMAERFRLANLREPLLRYRYHAEAAGIRHREAQIAAGWAAVASARLGREGRPVPIPPRDGFGIADLASFSFSPEERRGLLLVLAELSIEASDGAGVSGDALLRRLAGVLLPGRGDLSHQALAGAALAAAAHGTGQGSRLAHRMAAMARISAAAGDWRGAARWALRASVRHPLGPFGIAGLALGRALRQRSDP
jgi:hypothetical protein